jgi:hypothetical protein
LSTVRIDRMKRLRELLVQRGELLSAKRGRKKAVAAES